MKRKWMRLPLFFFGTWLGLSFATLAVIRLIGITVDSEGVRAGVAGVAAFAAAFGTVSAVIDGGMLE